MPDSPAPFDFGYPAAPGGDFPGILGDPGQEDTPLPGLGGGTGTATSGAFPVGGVFISILATDPATTLGYGTWEAMGQGRCLIGADGGSYNGGDYGGSEIQYPSAHPFIAQHTHYNYLSTDASSANHNSISAGGAQSMAYSFHTHVAQGYSGYDSGVSLPDHNAISTVQPYFVVYMWVRTA